MGNQQESNLAITAKCMEKNLYTRLNQAVGQSGIDSIHRCHTAVGLLLSRVLYIEKIRCGQWYPARTYCITSTYRTALVRVRDL